MWLPAKNCAWYYIGELQDHNPGSQGGDSLVKETDNEPVNQCTELQIVVRTGKGMCAVGAGNRGQLLTWGARQGSQGSDTETETREK